MFSVSVQSRKIFMEEFTIKPVFQFDVFVHDYREYTDLQAKDAERFLLLFPK